MSRAFVSDKEDWAYCAKAGERCFHAQQGRECSVAGCPHFNKTEKVTDRTGSGLKVVARRRKDPAGDVPEGVKDSKPGSPQNKRTTKRSTVKIPKRWGGRSGER